MLENPMEPFFLYYVYIDLIYTLYYSYCWLSWIGLFISKYLSTDRLPIEPLLDNGLKRGFQKALFFICLSQFWEWKHIFGYVRFMWYFFLNIVMATLEYFPLKYCVLKV